MIQNGFDEKEAQAQYLKWRKWKVEQELITPFARKEGRLNP